MFARWKVKYQRATGYIALGTFIIVLYGLIRELYASPYFPFKPDFALFTLLFMGIAFALIVAIAELDWRYMFKNEQAQIVTKAPLLNVIVYQSAWMVNQNPNPVLEQMLRQTFRSVGAEKMFNDTLRELGQQKL
jgi:hypothetical protein